MKAKARVSLLTQTPGKDRKCVFEPQKGMYILASWHPLRVFLTVKGSASYMWVCLGKDVVQIVPEPPGHWKMIVIISSHIM